jgi:hypothetical protein
MRFPARLLLTGAAAFALASCYSERPVSPAGVPTVGGNPALRALVVAQTFNLVIPAAGGSISIGGVYTLDFPAGAVCDPNAADTKAGYASQAWDSPCTTATSDIAITATLKYSNGKLYADFQPALRFSPNSTVTLSTNALASVIEYYRDHGLTGGSIIEYSPAIDAAGVSDALSDPSLRTTIHGSTGVVSRRIKHFSGYVAWMDGRWVECDPADGDPRCIWVDDDGIGGGGL